MSRKLRVLLVPDYKEWITGRIAQSIARYNSWIEPTICSAFVVQKFLSRFGVFPGNIDIVHFLTPVIGMSQIPHFFDSVPCVTTIHHIADWEDEVRPNVNADAIMVVATQWQKDLIERGVRPDKIVLVPNGVDTNTFRPASETERNRLRRKLKLPLDAFVVGFFGKCGSDLKGRKGIDTLLEAVLKLKKRIPNLACLFIGLQWEPVCIKLKASGVNSVTTGFIPKHKQLAPMYGALDVFWVTSRIEGGPVPLLEAMSSGICCVTTPVGIAIDLARDGQNCFVVPIDDVDLFVSRTEQLAADAALRKRIACEARQTIEAGYRQEQVVQEVDNLYAVALKAFSERMNIPMQHGLDKCTIRDSAKCVSDDNSFLHAVPKELVSWVRSQERLLSVSFFSKHGEGFLAFRNLLMACIYQPFDRKVWGRLFRFGLLGKITNPIRYVKHVIWR